MNKMQWIEEEKEKLGYNYLEYRKIFIVKVLNQDFLHLKIIIM